MAASAQLGLLLTHQLATDESAGSSCNVAFVLQIVKLHKLVSQSEIEAREEGHEGEKATSFLHR